MVEIPEKSFEASTGVVSEPTPAYGAYAPGGYLKRHFNDYERALVLDPGMTVAFVEATQPKERGKYAALYSDARERFTDADLEKLYHFARLLARYLPVKQERLADARRGHRAAFADHP